ncbi:MAG: flavin reductase family protein [Rhizobiales bacterium]|nr:flavin reductase family protein [Hyphomicrobiales bacterium]
MSLAESSFLPLSTPFTGLDDISGAVVESAAFRNAMRHLAGAVSVVTVGRGADRTGFTATSVSSLSAEASSIIVSLNRTSSSWPVVQRHGSFCVNILSDDQQQIAENFAGKGGIQGVDRYEGARWREFTTGALGLADALAVLDCQLEEAISRHSHSILIGRVRAVALRAEAKPLLYWHGAYRRLTDRTA